MKSILTSVLLFCCLLTSLTAQEKYTISGMLQDANSGEDLIAVNVYVDELEGVGTTSNEYGFYSLTLKEGTYTLVFSYIGYDDKEVPINLTANVTKNIELGGDALELNEVVVTARAEDEKITNTEVGVERLSIAEISAIPVLFGEKDILKTVQLLPGVKSAGEGNSGFYVRGGSSDQNLILLDEAPVYNASHLLGFFSVFNSDAIKDMKLYKGSIPAEYGGRLSSVMDIRMKDGNKKKFGVTGSIGLISSKLTLEGPLQKDKSSFMISGRRTYADVFLQASKDFKDNTLYFYDLNAKANYTFSDKNRIFLSGYFGRDRFGFGDTFGFDWGNATATVRWNHIFNNKLFSNTSLIYSNYNYEIVVGGGVFQISSAIKDWNLKQDFDYFLNDKIKLQFGANVVHHTLDPGELKTNSENIAPPEIDKKFALESSAYIGAEHKISSRLTLNYGLRYNNFTQLGPGTIYTFNRAGDITDEKDYKSNESVVSYNGLAPRFSGSYVLNNNNSIKAAYARTYQNVHLLSNSTASTPIDVWIPSSNNVKPEIADQVSIGYFQNFKDNAYEFSVETYYKTFQNAIDYRAGADITLNPEVEAELLYGKGRAYGIELLLKKKKGAFTGWISYTLARSERQVTEVNRGEWYSAKQDRIHDISIVGMYRVNERLNFSATWVYYTGNAVTFPTGKYEVDGIVLNYYGDRNSNRMPDYHRLDLGCTLENKPYKYRTDAATGEKIKVPKRFTSSWNFSVYNAYGRENAYSITFAPNEDDPSISESTQIALFKWIPSVAYSFSF